METEFKAFGKHILIQPEVSETKSASGLLMTTSKAVNARYQSAVIVDVGPDMESKLKLEKGNRIVYDKIQGHDLRLNGIPFKNIQERDIVGILGKDETLS